MHHRRRRRRRLVLHRPAVSGPRAGSQVPRALLLATDTLVLTDLAELYAAPLPVGKVRALTPTRTITQLNPDPQPQASP